MPARAIEFEIPASHWHATWRFIAAFGNNEPKTSVRLLRRLHGVGTGNGEKVFASFFKKKRFLPLPAERLLISMVGMNAKEISWLFKKENALAAL